MRQELELEVPQSRGVAPRELILHLTWVADDGLLEAGRDATEPVRE